MEAFQTLMVSSINCYLYHNSVWISKFSVIEYDFSMCIAGALVKYVCSLL